MKLQNPLAEELTEAAPVPAPPPPRDAQREGGFLHRLESLRGVAALMVAGWHTLAINPKGWEDVAAYFLLLACNGDMAVVLFFVLSGLVLGMSLERSQDPPGLAYGLYCLRRVFRICPAHWVALLAIVAAVHWLDVTMVYPGEVSTWLRAHWTQPITMSLFLRNCIFMGEPFNTPTWTLRVEMICSLLLPLVIWFSRRLNWAGRAALLAGLMAVSAGSLHSSVSFFFMFYLGYLIPSAGRWLMERSRRRGMLAEWIPLTSLALLLTAIVWSPGDLYRYGRLLEGLMGAVFISALLYGPELSWFRIFDWRITRFYGRISYSFYLYQMATIYFAAKTALRIFPNEWPPEDRLLTGFILLIVSVVIATLLAWLSCRLVERPGIVLSKRICQSIRTRVTGGNVPPG